MRDPYLCIGLCHALSKVLLCVRIVPRAIARLRSAQRATKQPCRGSGGTPGDLHGTLVLLR